jgi:hypothetical protein
MAGEVLLAVVFVPGDFIIILRSGEHIHIPVPIHIDGIDRFRPISPIFASNNGVGLEGDLSR